MTLNDMQSIFDTNNNIKFKLYSLEYIIEQKDGFVEIYAIDYASRKNKYKTFKDAINNFKVYNEPLSEQLNRIVIINQGEGNGII